jgi:integrase/recombinase XerD
MCYIDAFIDHERYLGHARRTMERRRTTLEQLAVYVSPRPLLDMTGIDLEGFLGHWAHPQTRASYFGDVRAFFKWAWRRDLVAADPTAKVERPKVPQREARPLGGGEVRRLIDLTIDPMVRRMIMLGAYAGLRCSEIAGLRGDDVFVAERILVVRNGKGGKDRVVPMTSELVEELGEVWTGPLFPGTTGARVGRIITRQMRAVGIRARPHDLRHSFGTHAAKALHGDLVKLASIMGHASTTTTERYVRWWRPDATELDGLYPSQAA